MSGVIDADGTQWEHCNNCGAFVDINLLCYEKPTEKYKYGRDLCRKCAEKTPAPVVIAENIETIVVGGDGHVFAKKC